ncbi:MAG: hypothetical protein R6W78_19190 [Bacteroidales bacterium]
MIGRIKYIMIFLLAIGIFSIPVGHHIIRHLCNHTNTAYYSFNSIKTSCHTANASCCIDHAQVFYKLYDSGNVDECCSHRELPGADNVNSISSACCTNEVIDLKNTEIVNDYRTNLKFNSPESTIPEGFSPQQKHFDVQTYPTRNFYAVSYYPPPVGIYILTAHLII